MDEIVGVEGDGTDCVETVPSDDFDSTSVGLLLLLLFLRFLLLLLCIAGSRYVRYKLRK